MTHALLQQHLAAYLGLRKALGCPIISNTKWLESFIAFLNGSEQTPDQPVSSRLVFDWLDASMSPDASSLNRSRRLSMIRQFLEYLSASDPNTQTPEPGLFASYKRPKPFLFTNEELEKVLAEAAQWKAGDFSSVVLHTAIGLIAATGLRASEALGLDRNDVMPRDRPGTLLIRDSKFGKSRLVPLHPSVQRQLSTYAGHRELLGYGADTPAFFVSRHRRRLSYATLSGAFAEIIRRLGIRARNGSRSPTLHSLRHTFAVTRLRVWHEEGVDVKTRLGHLATYLGHIDFRETFWYVTSTPELLVTATAAFLPPRELGGE